MIKIISKVLKKLFIKYKPEFYKTHYLHGPSDRLIIGKRVSLANTVFNTRSGKIIIEDGVIFGHNAMVLTGIHAVNVKGSEKHRTTLEDEERDIHIRKGAWIASGVIIVGPVVIGENAVIGAGSVVVKDIPSSVLAAGNPARVVKEINYEKSH